MNSLRLLTFDVTGTLLQFRISPVQQYILVGNEFGIKTDPKAMASNFKVHWHRMNTKHPNFGKSTGLGWEQWWRELVCQTFMDSRDSNKIESCTLHAIANHLLKNYETAAYYKLCPGAKDILLHLQKQSIPVGIISNFDERLSTILDEIGILKLFKFVLTSYEVGIEKPDRGIFELALKQLDHKVAPKYAMHVGNKPELDYIAAMKLGWNAALVHLDDPEAVLKKHPEIKPYLIFRNLSEIQTYISSLC